MSDIAKDKLGQECLPGIKTDDAEDLEDLYRAIHGNSKYYDAIYFYLNPEINAGQWVNSFKAEYQKLYNRPLKGLSYEEIEEALFCLPPSLSSAVCGVVWFTLINSREININYINFKNRPRGEDL